MASQATFKGDLTHRLPSFLFPMVLLPALLCFCIQPACTNISMNADRVLSQKEHTGNKKRKT